MPASSFAALYMQDTRNNFDAMRPAPVCLDANQAVGQCQQIHISTNCYYGYHEPISTANIPDMNDCEMMETAPTNEVSPPCSTTRKRSATSDDNYPQTKKLRDEVQRERNCEPEMETMKLEKNIRLDESTEDLMETLFWNTHGGNIFHFLQCS